MSSKSIPKTGFGFRAGNWDTSSWKDRKNLHWFETRWWIYECINPSFSPLQSFCLLCCIVSKPVYACFLLPWSRWWSDTCFLFQFDEYFQNGLKQETNWDTGILSWGNQPPNAGISICKDEGRPVITWSILSPYHHPSQFPFLGDTKHPKHFAWCRISLAFGLGFGRDQWGRHNGKQWYFSMVMTPPFAKNLHPPLPIHVACLCQ